MIISKINSQYTLYKVGRSKIAHMEKATRLLELIELFQVYSNT